MLSIQFVVFNALLNILNCWHVTCLKKFDTYFQKIRKGIENTFLRARDLICCTTQTGVFESVGKHDTDMNEDIEDDGGEIQTFLHQHHAGCVLSRLHDLREREELCDVTLVVEGRAIQAHRAVLAASSQYFNAMFTAKMSERNQATVRLIFDFNG